jgi:hypothetical protein
VRGNEDERRNEPLIKLAHYNVNDAEHACMFLVAPIPLLLLVAQEKKDTILFYSEEAKNLPQEHQ